MTKRTTATTTAAIAAGMMAVAAGGGYVIRGGGGSEEAPAPALVLIYAPVHGDGNFDGVVDFQDINVATANWGARGLSEAQADAAITQLELATVHTVEGWTVDGIGRDNVCAAVFFAESEHIRALLGGRHGPLVRIERAIAGSAPVAPGEEGANDG